MSDVNKECGCSAATEEECCASCCGNLTETLDALTELVNAICNCGCNGGPSLGEEEELDTVMDSDEGNEEFAPVASSVYPPYSMWIPFKDTETTLLYDGWCGNGPCPQYLGVIAKKDKYVITQIDITRRGDRAPKEVNLQYRDENDEWHDLTEIETLEDGPPKSIATIMVPEQPQIVVTGVRVYIHSSYVVSGYPTGPYPVISRMQIHGKKVL